MKMQGGNFDGCNKFGSNTKKKEFASTLIVSSMYFLVTLRHIWYKILAVLHKINVIATQKINFPRHFWVWY